MPISSSARSSKVSSSGSGLLHQMDRGKANSHDFGREGEAFLLEKIICQFGLPAVIGRWVEELPQVLWSYHTTLHSPIQETPFRLTFGTNAMIPIDVEESFLRTILCKSDSNKEELRANLDFLQEERKMAHIRECAVKGRVAKKYISTVFPHPIRKDDLVLIRTLMGVAMNKLTPN
ncbi:hypothetical protein CR513_17592, partial [Mucuna pruriens]